MNLPNACHATRYTLPPTPLAAEAPPDTLLRIIALRALSACRQCRALLRAAHGNKGLRSTGADRAATSPGTWRCAAGWRGCSRARACVSAARCRRGSARSPCRRTRGRVGRRSRSRSSGTRGGAAWGNRGRRPRRAAGRTAQHRAPLHCAAHTPRTQHVCARQLRRSSVCRQ